eukprot:TRINITY_DN18221_c0_g1_i1.p1 TRINITY_DN18221_c0_g1~~TRINITY_DN18221_c0_g1_i1.p1  ORF type:complete len:186 (-),score=23.06 TRINITY_DN18221_c0_g1_i1:235-768(-)
MAGIMLYVRHLPCKVLETKFSETIDELGLCSQRFRLWIPKRRGLGKTNNFGYGFVTCSCASDAEAFIRTFQGYQFENIQSSKKLSIEPARRSALSPDFSAWQMESPMTFDADAVTHAVAPASQDQAAADANYTCHAEQSAAVRDSTTTTGVLGLRSAIPDAHALPPTRLTAGSKGIL